MFAIKRILYPTDFSSYSNQAYFHAVALAETHGASLTILYVFNPAWEDHDERDVGADKEYWQGQLVQIRPTNPDIPVEHVLVQGDPGIEIPRFAADAGIDMVVMGTHGRTGREASRRQNRDREPCTARARSRIAPGSVSRVTSKAMAVRRSTMHGR